MLMGRVQPTFNMAGRIVLLSAFLIATCAGFRRDFLANAFLANASKPIINQELLSGTTRLTSAAPNFDPAMASCHMKTLSSARSTWGSLDEPCHQKLPFDMWVLMKAEGMANDTDAQHVLFECLQLREINSLELITPKNWDSTLLDGAPGEVLSETEHTATYLYSNPLDLEAMCADDQVTAVHRVDASTSKSSRSGKSRRLQLTTSEAGVAHQVYERHFGNPRDLHMICSMPPENQQRNFPTTRPTASHHRIRDPSAPSSVAELIAGLESLGCTRTRGEDQNLCIMSDSFNRGGKAPSLQAFGDLPPEVDVVKELPATDPSFLDEGSAMMELAFDIASGANYKFNTAKIGEQAFADDIGTLATVEECDVIVDDIRYYYSPGYRDGVIANAANDAVEAGSLYFTSAGNFGAGSSFTANFECTTTIFGDDPVGECPEGVAVHVFDGTRTDYLRYLFPIALGVLSQDTTLRLQWDDDDGSARTIKWGLFVVLPFSGTIVNFMEGTNTEGRATSTILLPYTTDFDYYLTIYQVDSAIEPIVVRVFSTDNDRFIDPTASGGSIFGQPCASKAISVAAMDWYVATGANGAFDDPETASVTTYSSRGPCFVDTGSGIETRDHPVTTAATALTTSTPGFEVFPGTSASAPVAAAIATLIRAACSDDRVVTYEDIMEMFTDYEYTIDVTSDAGGAVETFGTEAGFGIVSAGQMLAWVEANCPASCSGSAPTSSSCDTYTEEGCFLDSKSNRLMSQMVSLSPMSAEICFSICNNGVFTHFGTQYAEECWCGMNPQLSKNGGETSSSECNMACAGATSGEACGGNRKMTVYGIDCFNEDEGTDGFSAVGCYVDRKNNRVFPDVETRSPMSAAICADICDDGSNTHFGTQYGSECWCGSNPDLTTNGDEVSSLECNSDCAGSSTGEKCGGSYRISIYEFEASDSTPENYIGCYTDVRDDRAMGAVASLSTSTMTNEVCMSWCSGQGFAFAGTQYGEECWCDDSFNKHGSSSGCTFSCSGDSSTTCGGFFALSVYST